jgi:hypothetical protein
MSTWFILSLFTLGRILGGNARSSIQETRITVVGNTQAAHYAQFRVSILPPTHYTHKHTNTHSSSVLTVGSKVCKAHVVILINLRCRY